MTIDSAAEFVRLRESGDSQEYRRAASEPASIMVWSEVIESYPEMRFWVAQNKTVPLEILKLLAHDEDPRVRAMVASKRKLDQETLALLARDQDESVRAAVARNPSTSGELLQELRNDEWHVVSELARERLR